MLGCWNPHGNANSHPGSTHRNLASPIRAQVLFWEVDDQKRDEEDDTGVNIQRRRGRFMNDKVDKEV